MNQYQTFFTKTVLTATAAALLLTAPAHASEFTDASAIAHPTAVAALAERGVISGRPDGSFDPGGVTRRNEMAKMLSLLLDPDGGEYPSAGFTDVSGTWAEPYVNHCYSLGLLSGRGEGIFAPQEAVSGTETAKMLLSAAGHDTAEYTGAGWAERVDRDAAEAGLYEGLSAPPAAPLTRDNAAQMLYNALPLLESGALELGFTPAGVAVAPDGALLLTDTYHRVVISLRDEALDVYAGAITPAQDANGQPIGGYVDAEAAESTFRKPWGIAPFMGGWAVTDVENNAVRLIRDGQVMTVNPDVSGAGKRNLSRPTGLAAGPDGSLYVADTGNGVIRRITAQGKMTTEAQGLEEPTGLCWYNGSLYIAETGAHRIVRLRDGKIYEVAGTGEDGYGDGGTGEAEFSCPQAVAADGNGRIYVSDTGNCAVRCIEGGTVRTVVKREIDDGLDSYPVSPLGLAVDGGTLYVCDGFTGTLLLLNP